jgi:hypothetical protein
MRDAKVIGFHEQAASLAAAFSVGALVLLSILGSLAVQAS